MCQLEDAKYADIEPKSYSPRKRFEEKKRPPTCYICKGPHHMKVCPKLGNLTAMAKKEGSLSEDEEEPQEMAKLSIMQRLNVMSTRGA